MADAELDAAYAAALVAITGDPDAPAHTCLFTPGDPCGGCPPEETP